MHKTWLVLALFLAACGSNDGKAQTGSSSGSGSGETACEDWGAMICQRACECGVGECRYGAGNFSVRFADSNDCLMLTQAECGAPAANSEKNIAFFQACTDALEGAQCVAADGATPAHVDWPAACNPEK